MVSSRLGNFLKRTSAYVGEGRAVNEADILLQLKFQHNLTPEKVSSLRDRECPCSEVRTERRDGSGTNEERKAGGIFVCKLDRLCEYERIRKAGESMGAGGPLKIFKVRKIQHVRLSS